MTNTTDRQALSAEAQTQILNVEVARYARQGWTVASVTGAQAVLQRKKKIGWVHVALALATAGLWLLYVLVRLVNRKTETLIVSVDAYGRVSAR